MSLDGEEFTQSSPDEAFGALSTPKAMVAMFKAVCNLAWKASFISS